MDKKRKVPEDFEGNLVKFVKREHVSSGCLELDGLLTNQRGFCPGKIYEIYGLANSKRHQLIHEMVKKSTAQGHKCLYLSSDAFFPGMGLLCLDKVRLQYNRTLQVYRVFEKLIAAKNAEYRLVVVSDFGAVVTSECDGIDLCVSKNQRVIRRINQAILERREHNESYRLNYLERELKYNKKREKSRRLHMNLKQSLDAQRDEYLVVLMQMMRRYLLINKQAIVVLSSSLTAKMVGLKKDEPGHDDTVATQLASQIFTSPGHSSLSAGGQLPSLSPSIPASGFPLSTLPLSQATQTASQGPIVFKTPDNSMLANDPDKSHKLVSPLGDRSIWTDFVEARITLVKNWHQKPSYEQYLNDPSSCHTVTDWATVEKKSSSSVDPGTVLCSQLENDDRTDIVRQVCELKLPVVQVNFIDTSSDTSEDSAVEESGEESSDPFSLLPLEIPDSQPEESPILDQDG